MKDGVGPELSAGSETLAGSEVWTEMLQKTP